MRSKRSVRLVASCATVLGLLAPGAARGNVVYTFTTTAGANATNPAAPLVALGVTLDLYDAAVALGSVRVATQPNLQALPGTPPLVSGAGSFASVAFTVGGYGGGATPATLDQSSQIVFDVALTFSASGDVTGSDATFETYTEVAHVAGAGAAAAGVVGTDSGLYACGGSVSVAGRGGTSNCTVSGAWTRTADAAAMPVGTAVPEPASFALLGAGLLGLALLRRPA